LGVLLGTSLLGEIFILLISNPNGGLYNGSRATR
jgi:hypothetical protein